METPKYELKINAFAPGELAALVNGLAEQLSGRVKAHIATHSDLAPTMAEMKEEAPKKEKAKKTKVEAVEATEIQKQGTEAHTALEAEMQKETVSSEPITKEQIAQALQGVSEKINFQKAKEILTSYKNAEGNPCKKVSDVLAVDYGSFMAACKAAI